jgi:hypothetical protein
VLIHLPRAIESRRWEVAEACQYLEVPLVEIPLLSTEERSMTPMEYIAELSAESKPIGKLAQQICEAGIKHP